jgi:glycosyltransferase involved in cell wall biosynthesis
MITNHGIHQWQVIPGLPDTGGQNVFVNQFSEALTQFGFKITVVNRGGYAHPRDGKVLKGLSYKDDHQRILYLQDSRKEFVRKEDMHERIPELVNSLIDFFDDEDSPIDLIISHYWDAAKIGVQFNNHLPEKVKHIWVPHSLGKLKKENVSQDKWEALRINERIKVERSLIQALDGIAATSSAIIRTLKDDYGYTSPEIFLPPCVDINRYHPHEIKEEDEVWSFLSERSTLPTKEIQKRKIITEISRTDTTKRKDVLIKAFAKAHQRYPESLLLVSIDENHVELARELKTLISDYKLEADIIVVGSIWDILPKIYAVSDIYCTPSVMEGFGMSAQEAAATKVPVVASELVPYVVEYLMGDEVVRTWRDESTKYPINVGSGAVVAKADDVDGFAYAMEMLLTDDVLRIAMGESAYHATIPYFTWSNMVERFLSSINYVRNGRTNR